MKNYYLIASILILPGCVSIEAPENLVSDTVKVGKEAYQSIKKSVYKEEDQNNDSQQFVYKHIMGENESASQASINCISSALELAKQALNRNDVEMNSATVSSNIDQNEKSMLCTISIKG